MAIGNFVKRIQDVMRNDAGVNGDAQRIEQIVWTLFLKIYDAKEEDWELFDDDYESIIPEECQWRNWAKDNKDGQALTGDALLDFVNNTLFPTLKNLEITADTKMNQVIVKQAFEDANNYMKDGILLRQVINIIDEIDFSEYEERHTFGTIYESFLKDLQSAGNAGEFYTPRAVTDFMVKVVKPQLGDRIADFACGTGGFLVSALNELYVQAGENTANKEIYDNSVYGVEKKALPHILCVTNMLLHDIDNPEIVHGNTLETDYKEYRKAEKFDVILMNPPYGGSEKDSVKINFPAELRSSETADLFMNLIMFRLKQNGKAAVILPDGFLFGTDNAKVNIKTKLLNEFNLHTVIRMPSSVFAPYTSITTNILFFDNTGATENTWFYRLDKPEGYKNFSKTKPMKLEHFNPALEWWENRVEIEEDGFPKAKCFTKEQLIDELGCNLDQCGYPHIEEEILAPMDFIQLFQEECSSLTTTVEKSVEQIKGLIIGEKITTNLDLLQGGITKIIKLYSSFSDSMQKSILQYAMQGKLVEQRIEEGSSHDLVKLMNDEKQKLIKEKKIKKDKELPQILEEEYLFDIPETWTWMRVGNIGSWSSGATPSRGNPEYYGGNIPWLKTGDLTDGMVSDIPENITELALEKTSVRLNPIGSVLMAMYGATIGKLGILEVEATTNQACCACIPYTGMYNKFLFYYLMSIRRLYIGMAEGGAQPNISKEKIVNSIIPVPPLEEQKRIVAKIEEMLPICNKLIK